MEAKDSDGTVKKARIKEWRIKKNTKASKRAKRRKMLMEELKRLNK